MAAWVLVLVVAWFVLAPASIGGPDSYVVTDGTSMLPTIQSNSLVVVRSQPSYHVGEIAAYYNPQLRSVVLHRIVAIHHGHYTFKGDNNPFPDAGHPTKSAILGTKWIYWQAGGTLLHNLRDPVVGASLLGLVGMWAVAEGPAKRRRRRGRRRRAHAFRG